MTQQIYYTGLFILSFLLTLIYVFRWHKHFDVHLAAIFILIPLANLAYEIMYSTHQAETAVAMIKIAYMAGCFLPWLAAMCVMDLCRIRVSRAVRALSFSLSAAVFASVLTIGHGPFFYRSLSLVREGTIWIQEKSYGPFHTMHYVLVVLYLIAEVIAIIYSYRHKKQVSRWILFLLFIPVVINVLGYAVNGPMRQIGYELVPLTYALAQLVYLLIVHRMILYNVSEMVMETEVQSGDTGFITIDSKERYLGSNETARKILPELDALTVDRNVRECETLSETVISWLDRFERNDGKGKFIWVRDPKYGSEESMYSVEVSYLYDGSHRCGYQIFMQDDTQNQKYIRLLDRYNTDLQKEVAAKTERLVVMHDRLILGMAAMVESRDNSTGGHIRRTSEGVRILIEAIRREGGLRLSDEFCRDIIKAAPMHDLGKIAVDDAVLRKPGRFTDEEFEKMKTHAAEGARIVHEILRDTDDEDFRKIAENVAHYHHERWDGSGYPDGLWGEEIPLEARIMAIADVYDALVSKRVYKEEFSFEKADKIITEGMGTQFDAGLRKYYESARPELEAYYAKEKVQEA